MGWLWDGHEEVTFIYQRVLPIRDRGTAMRWLWDDYETVVRQGHF